MNREAITTFIQAHWNWITMIVGVILLVGAARNWNWLCDPVGKPNSQLFGRKARRLIFFLLGMVLMVIGIWSVALET